MIAPKAPVARPKVAGKENTPAPTIEPTTRALNAQSESFCVEVDIWSPVDEVIVEDATIAVHPEISLLIGGCNVLHKNPPLWKNILPQQFYMETNDHTLIGNPY